MTSTCLRTARPALATALVAILAVAASFTSPARAAEGDVERMLRALDAQGCEELLQAVEREPADAGLRERLGFALLDAGRDLEAADQFKRAWEQEWHRWRSVMGLGAVSARQGDTTAARLYFDMALVLQPRSAELLTRSAELHLQSGDIDTGIAEARAALELVDSSETRVLLANLLARSRGGA